MVSVLEYSHDPTVDMSGYIPLDNRFDFSGVVVESGSSFRQEVFSEPIARLKSGSVGFLPKQKRCFQRSLSGLLKASYAHQRCSFLTLTSGVGFDVSCLPSCWQTLRKRIEHQFGFLAQYLAVRTSEGNGVLHILLVASEFIPKHWISHAWSEITQGVSRIIRIREVRMSKKSDAKKMARYMTQYVAGQMAFERFSSSWDWIFRGAVGVWKDLCRVHGVHQAIVRWEWLLSQVVRRSSQAIFDASSSLFWYGDGFRSIGG
jgi:DNA binding domain of tn916 integrase.